MKNGLSLLFSFLRQNKSGALTATWLMLTADIFSGEIQSDLIIAGILGLYIFFIRILKLNSKVTFLFCFFIIGLLFIEFIFTGISEHTEKAAVWLFLFMAIGILQELMIRKK